MIIAQIHLIFYAYWFVFKQGIDIRKIRKLLGCMVGAAAYAAGLVK